MAESAVDLDFDTWLLYLFVAPDDWWGHDPEPAQALAFMIRLFEQPEVLLERFSHKEINQGLWFLVDSGGANQMCALFDESLPWADRRRALLGIVTLYRSLFALACSDLLGHLDQGKDERDPIHSICYMWWDLFPSWGRGLDARTRETVFDVMEATLAIESEPCREGALHGLGHFFSSDPDAVGRIIDRWLDGHPRISAQLRSYALSARTGCVL